MITKQRLDDIYELDMKLHNGEDFIGNSDLNKDFYIPYIDIVCHNDSEWDNMISKMTTELQRRKNNG